MLLSPHEIVDPAFPVNLENPLNRGRVAWWYGLPHLSHGSQLRNILIGRKYEGSLTAAPVWTQTGRGDVGLTFNGSTQCASATIPLSLFSSKFTIAITAKSTVAAGGTDALRYPFILGGGGENAGITWTHTSAGYSGACYMIGAGGFPVVAWPTKPAANTVTRIVMTWNGATIGAYLNAVSQGTAANSSFGSITTDIAVIGAGGTGPVKAFPGTVSDVSLWDRVLSASEIGADYSQHLRGYRTPDSPLNFLRSWSFGVPAAAGDTFTAAVALSATPATLAASATFAPGTKTATAALVATKATLAASGTVTAPVYTAAAGLSATKATLAASATHAPPTYTAAADLNATKATLSASAIFAAAVYQATVALSATKAVLAAVASHVVPTYTGGAALTVTKATLAASGTVSPPVYAASVALSATKTILSGLATFDSGARTANVTLTATKAELAANATFTKPVYAATVNLVATKAVLNAIAGDGFDPMYRIPGGKWRAPGPVAGGNWRKPGTVTSGKWARGR